MPGFMHHGDSVCMGVCVCMCVFVCSHRPGGTARGKLAHCNTERQ